MGYAGGTTPAPTYREIGDHTETIQVDFDPDAISYEDLLDVFWDSHRPTTPSWSRQYRSAILYADERQRQQAEASLARETERLGGRIHTAIEPLRTFHRAEDYHQKYRLRNTPAARAAFDAHFADDRALVDSTAAARMNGLLDGHGRRAAVDAALEEAGFPAEVRSALLPEHG